MKKRILAFTLAFVMCLGLLSGCGGAKKVDAFVIMTDQLDGLFNPFFSTSAADGTIVAMTQIGMLSSKYVNGKVETRKPLLSRIMMSWRMVTPPPTPSF